MQAAICPVSKHNSAPLGHICPALSTCEHKTNRREMIRKRLPTLWRRGSVGRMMVWKTMLQTSILPFIRGQQSDGYMRYTHWSTRRDVAPSGYSADSASHRGKMLPVSRLGSVLSSAGASRHCHSLSTVLPQWKAPAPGSRLLLRSKLNRASNSAGAGCSPGYRHRQSVLSERWCCTLGVRPVLV